MKRRNIVIITIIFIVVIIQFVRINRTNPPVEIDKDFITLENPPEQVALILKNACYDCHSHKTIYPWYTNVAPFSWLIGQHIKEGRKHLNFSTWTKYDKKKQLHKLKEIAEEVEEEKMPIPNYTWMHPEAKLSNEDRQILVDWVMGETE